MYSPGGKQRPKHSADKTDKTALRSTATDAPRSYDQSLQGASASVLAQPEQTQWQVQQLAFPR
ncbi:hypothetical protein N7494_010866 [Penicillium frequentans]|uniref:Uncharacterized protein n=1 Tax=Penicillium frequentans TaxID=3151616 RepID=A0AAD6CIN8_9EURO|nr:hypothetical protein N7494_010866 [Penicillium glabrum]